MHLYYKTNKLLPWRDKHKKITHTFIAQLLYLVIYMHSLCSNISYLFHCITMPVSLLHTKYIGFSCKILISTTYIMPYAHVGLFMPGWYTIRYINITFMQWLYFHVLETSCCYMHTYLFRNKTAKLWVQILTTQWWRTTFLVVAHHIESTICVDQTVTPYSKYTTARTVLSICWVVAESSNK